MNDEHKTYTCEFCDSTFLTLKSLDGHKRTAKYCLVIQGKNNQKYKCIGCEKVFVNKNRLTSHHDICIDIKIHNFENEKKEIQQIFDAEKKQLQQYIEKLEDTIVQKDKFIKELAEKAIINAKPSITHTTTTNNTFNNLNIISQEHLHEQAQHLTIEHIKKGAVGYSEYFLEYPLKERVACTDYSRRKLKYKNENGEIVTDPEMSALSDLLFKSIKDRNKTLTVQYTNELTDKFKTAKDPTQLAYFMEVAGKFSDQDIAVFKMFNGDKNDFFHDILRNICSKTLVQ